MRLFALLFVVSAAFAVELEVRATEGGGPVADLESQDFTIKEGGQERAIESFEYVDDLTETKVYVAIDVSAGEFPRVQQSLEEFLAKRLPDGLQISLGGAPFTSDRATLSEYLANGTELPSKTPGFGVDRIWSAGTGSQLQGRPVINRYRQLVSQLAATTPGRKAIVLFRDKLDLGRSGLNTQTVQRRSGQLRQADADIMANQDDLERLGAESLFARVSFYPTTVQGSGLSSGGLNNLANVTGGRPLLGGSDPALIFDLVAEDATGYYVLGYRPELEGKGRAVPVRVDVARKGVDLRFVRRYLDIDGLGAIGTQTSLLEADPAEAKLNPDVAYAFFRGTDGQAVAIVTAGVATAELEAGKADKGVGVELTLAAGAADGSGGWQAGPQSRSKQVFAKKSFEQSQKKGGVTVDVSSMLTIEAAGERRFRAAVQDEMAGTFGIDEQTLRVPDFKLPLETSTMLLTRRAVELSPDLPSQAWGELLDFGETRLIPESTREFRVGETILFTYRLYNPGGLLQNLPPVQLAVLKDEAQIEAQAQGENRVVEEEGSIQYLGALRTDNLGPGNYLILSAVPGRDDARQPYVEAAFTLVKK